MTLPNPDYFLVKEKMLHGFNRISSLPEENVDAFLEDDAETDTDMPGLLHENDFGEYYALQDFEE